MGTCHQCAALAEELAQARAELEAAKKDAERYAALNRHCSFGSSVYAPPSNVHVALRLRRWNGSYEDFDRATGAAFGDLADELARQDAASTTAPTVETAPGVTP